jgi:hypothetical protein
MTSITFIVQAGAAFVDVIGASGVASSGRSPATHGADAA